MGHRLINSDLRALEQKAVINYDRHHILGKEQIAVVTGKDLS